MSALGTVFRKEVIDSLRDRRTLLFTIVASMLSGPVVLVILFNVFAKQMDFNKPLKLFVSGATHAPALASFLARADVKLEEAPADFEGMIKKGDVDLVLAVDASYASDIAAGKRAIVRLYYDNSRQRAQPTIRRVQALLNAFSQQWGEARLILRGIAPEVADPLKIEVINVATPQQSGSALLSLIAFYAVLATLWGGTASALDNTAGERERGSLEPLLALPISPWHLVLGKWLAVSALALAVVSFTLGGYYLTLHAGILPEIGIPFVFELREAVLLFFILFPLALLFPAILLALGAFARTFKEAQTNSGLLIMVASLLPLLVMFQQQQDPPWLAWVPFLGHTAILNRVLRGEVIDVLSWSAVWITPLFCGVIALFVFKRALQREALLRGQ